MSGAESAPLVIATAARKTMSQGLPDQVDEWARWALLDSVSVMLGGADTQVVRASLRVAQRRFGDSPLLVAPGASSPEWAALVLATAANALDYDDGHVRGGGIHAGSAVVAGLLAAAPNNLPLDRFRSALVIGYEVAVRVGYLAAPETSGNDYRTSGYAATFGAVAALGAVAQWRADSAGVGGLCQVQQTAAGLRLAAAHAPVASFVSGGARESLGWAAATAVSIAELADAGIVPTGEEHRLVVPAGPTILDDPRGEWDEIGREFWALQCYTKPYPCCRAAHAAIDGVIDLLERGILDPRSDYDLHVGVPSSTTGLDQRRPGDLGEAQFAIPFLIGLTIARGVVGLRSLGRTPLETLLSDPQVRKASDRVQIHSEPQFEHTSTADYPATLKVFHQGELTHRSAVTVVTGSPDRPLLPSERLAKAHDLLWTHLGRDRTGELVDICLRPDSRSTLAEFRQHLKRQGGAQGNDGRM